MRVAFRTPAERREYLEAPRSPLLLLSCLLAIVVPVGVVGAELGGRLALMSAAFVVVSLATRLPRVLPVAAALVLIVAALALLAHPAPVPVLAAHPLAHTTTRR